MQDSSTAVGKIFNSLGLLGTSALESFSVKPKVATTAIGLTALYAGINSIKNIFKTISSFSDPKSSPAVPWVVHGLQGILEGGLSIGLAAPFLNIKNPFAKVINNKEVVQIKTLVAATAVPVILSEIIKMAQNNSLVLRIPLFGPIIKDITEMVFGFLKHITTNTGEQNAMGQAAPQLPPSIGS